MRLEHIGSDRDREAADIERLLIAVITGDPYAQLLARQIKARWSGGRRPTPPSSPAPVVRIAA